MNELDGLIDGWVETFEGNTPMSVVIDRNNGRTQILAGLNQQTEATMKEILCTLGGLEPAAVLARTTERVEAIQEQMRAHREEQQEDKVTELHCTMNYLSLVQAACKIAVGGQ